MRGSWRQRSRSLAIRHDDEQSCEAMAFTVSSAYAKAYDWMRRITREMNEVKSGGLLCWEVLE